MATDGQTERAIPSTWNSLAATIGVGWDFTLTENVEFRPIGNATLGHVSIDNSAIVSIIEAVTGHDLSFLDDGRLNAYGYGGSLMLDYEDDQPAREIDVELRLTYLRINGFF